MKTEYTSSEYVEWLNTESMHKASLNWISKLKFTKIEQRFFGELIRSYTLQLLDPKVFKKSKTIVSSLGKLSKKNKKLIKKIIIHENELQVMIDDRSLSVNEEAYKDEHRKLIIDVGKYLKDYRTLKTKLFKIIKDIMKVEKQKRLLN